MQTVVRFAGAVALLCAPALALAATPLANAGADQTFAASDLPQLVTLDGTGSSDPDGGTIVGYQWTEIEIPSGSTATLSSDTASMPTFTADLVGTYRYCLEVTDDEAEDSGTSWSSLPTVACTNVMVTTEFETLVLPAKGQRNWQAFARAWAVAIDALRGELDDLIADLASVLGGSEGAVLVGTDAKANLGGADNVEEALTFINTALSAAGPFLPLAGGTTDTMNGTIYSDAAVTVKGLDVADTLDGTTISFRGGDGGDSDGAAAAGDGGVANIVGGAGGAGSGAHAAGVGQAAYLSGGAGGTGTGAVLGGNGGAAVVIGGSGGTTGGAGAGTNGTVQIGITATSGVTIGAGAIQTTINGTLDIDGGTSLSINGTACTAAEITCPNLDTLVDSSNADALHTHTVPWPISNVDWDGAASVTSDTRFGSWALPTVAGPDTVRCYGMCASTDGDATNCAVRFGDDAAVVLTSIVIPDGECGNATGTFLRWEETFATSSLGGELGGQLHVDRDAGTGECEFLALQCVVHE